MNYKQKHQEDLEAAKGWLAIAKENNNKIAIQILKKFFPELRESEDERIRKEIIAYLDVQEVIAQGKDGDFKEWISWLKSLKPNHWKPSKQNIKDLEWCADLVKDKMGVGFHRLQVFIDEIKKL